MRAALQSFSSNEAYAPELDIVLSGHLDPLRHGETRCATFNLLASRRRCKRRQLGPVLTELYGLRAQATEMCLGYSIRKPHDRRRTLACLSFASKPDEVQSRPNEHG